MTKNQTLARDFAQLATIYGASGADVARAVCDALTPETRAELAKLAHEFGGMFNMDRTAGPRKAGPVLDDFIGPVSATSATAEANPTNKPSPMNAHDVIPALGRIHST